MIIGVFDSGKGGETVLREIKKRLPQETYIYFADSKNCPYGEKTQAELEEIVSEATEYLLARGAELIVVACNTATTRAITFLREKYKNVPFVGTEPAIKKACEETEVKDDEEAKIVLLCTPATAKSERTRELITLNKKQGQAVVVIPCPGLAKAIEDETETEIDQKLANLAGKFEDFEQKKSPGVSEVCSALNLRRKQGVESVKAVILGCTHYPIIRDKIQKIFEGAKIVDGGDGVAREVERIVLEKD